MRMKDVTGLNEFYIMPMAAVGANQGVTLHFNFTAYVPRY